MYEIIFVSVAAFFAGFVDAVAGGGGLIQIPALFIAYPHAAVATLLGTNKLPSFLGTSFAARQYLKHISIVRKEVLIRMALCALAAMLGSYTVSLISPHVVKPFILVMLIAVALYTYSHKQFGIKEHKHPSQMKYMCYGIGVAMLVGFYDGFLGPGSGNLFILGLVGLLGFDFLKASAHAKLLNLSSNFGSILLFGSQGVIMRKIVAPMAICNLLGAFVGTKMAFLRGNRFVRNVLLFAIVLAIVRYAREVF